MPAKIDKESEERIQKIEEAIRSVYPFEPQRRAEAVKIFLDDKQYNVKFENRFE